MIDVGFWEIAGYCLASFILGGIAGLIVIAMLVRSGE
jgi:hypothetical protein